MSRAPVGLAAYTSVVHVAFLGRSATIAAVVTIRPATEAASRRRPACDLGRVDDAGRKHVEMGLALGVEAVRLRFPSFFVDDDRTLDQPQRPLKSGWIGVSSARRTMLMPAWRSPFSDRSFSPACLGREGAPNRRPARCLPRPWPGWDGCVKDATCYGVAGLRTPITARIVSHETPFLFSQKIQTSRGRANPASRARQAFALGKA